MGRIQKYSFHPPNICRSALTKEYTESEGRGDRNAIEWSRDSAPKKGSGAVVRVLRLGFPSDYLSTGLRNKPTHKECLWIKPARGAGTAFVDIMFTYEDESALRDLITTDHSALNHQLLIYQRLQNGEAFAVTCFHSDEGHEPLRLKATSHDMTDVIALPVDPDNSGRPIRLTYQGKERNRNLLPVWELGCYRHPSMTDAEWEKMSEPYRTQPAGSFTRNAPPILGTHK
jgi:hypothetical protein